MSLCVKARAVEWIATVALVYAHLRSVKARSLHERGHDHLSAHRHCRQDITLQLGVAGREVDLWKGL